MKIFRVADEHLLTLPPKYIGSAVMLKSKVIASFDNRDDADDLASALEEAFEPYLEKAMYIG